MSEESFGNNLKPVEIDVTDDTAFKTGVVQYLQLISDQTRDLPSIRKKVENHDRLVQYGKWTAIPILAFLHQAGGYLKDNWSHFFGGH